MTSARTRNETGGASVEPTDADVYAQGEGTLGAAVTRRLREDDRAVTLIDGTHGPSDVPTRQADPTDVRAPTEAGLEIASTVLADPTADYP